MVPVPTDGHILCINGVLRVLANGVYGNILSSNGYEMSDVWTDLDGIHVGMYAYVTFHMDSVSDKVFFLNGMILGEINIYEVLQADTLIWQAILFGHVGNFEVDILIYVFDFDYGNSIFFGT